MNTGRNWAKGRKFPRYTCTKCGRVGTARIITPTHGTPEVPHHAGRCKRCP